MRQLSVIVLAMLTVNVGLAAPTQTRMFPVRVRILPENINVEEDVIRRKRAFQMSGASPSQVWINEAGFREGSEWRKRGTEFSGEYLFATDGVHYESKTLVPLMRKQSKTFPVYQVYDGQNTIARSVGINQVYSGDKRSVFTTLGDALFLFGALPKGVKETKRTRQGDREIVEYQGDFGPAGNQLLRVTERKGKPVSAISGRKEDNLRFAWAAYEIDGDKLTVTRFAGLNRKAAIEVYGKPTIEPYRPFVALQTGDSVADFRSGKEHRYEWKGRLEEPSSPVPAVSNPLFSFWVAVGAIGAGLVVFGRYRRKAGSQTSAGRK